MKPKTFYLLPSSLSAKLSLWIVLFVAILFLATFSLMFYYAREAVRTESLGKGEDLLEKMELIALNILHEKEVVARQTHWKVEHNLRNPEKIETYLQDILRNSPEIVGVAAAFETGYYPNQPGDYMIYYYRKGSKLIKSEQFAGESYQHQPWYEETKRLNGEYWSDPAEGYVTNSEPIISFGLPLRDNGRAIGVFAIDISLCWLSSAIENMRPIPSMTATIATRSGAFIVSPDTDQLRPGAMFNFLERYSDSKYSYMAYNMLAGDSGAVTLHDGRERNFVAYKPVEGTKWVMDVTCSEDDVMGNYNHLISLMLLVVVLALLMVIAICYFFIHRELRPLKVLEISAKQMSRGDFFTTVSISNRQDEVGSLTKSFVAMRRFIRQYMDNINHTREKLDQQHKALSATNAHISEADKVKTAFLQNMTDQMNQPVKDISQMVVEMTLLESELDHETIVKMADKMDASTQTVTSLLTRMLEVSTQGEEREDKA